MNCSRLKDTLEAAGQRVEQWQSTDGSKVLVLPHGGRVLGLFAPNAGKNFLWTHTALNEVETARAFYAGTQWHNSGGDRTWLAPEVDFFFPDYPDLKRYWQQRELDPGRYVVSRNDGALSWSTQATLALSRARRTIDLEIGKSLSPALNPLRHEWGRQFSEVKYAGYTLRTALTVASPGHRDCIGLWDLLQMPHGGDILVPTYSRGHPKIWMGSISSDDLIVSDHLVRYRMRASGEQKLGMLATVVTGRAGYLYGAGGETSLVIRNFHVNPSGEYVDIPWTEPTNLGFAFQACNVNSGLGAFSELEYHVPLAQARTDGSASEDRSQVWAFRGPEEAVRAIARRLLSPEV